MVCLQFGDLKFASSETVMSENEIQNKALFDELNQLIQSGRSKILLAVNRTKTLVYWQLGQKIQKWKKRLQLNKLIILKKNHQIKSATLLTLETEQGIETLSVTNWLQ